MVLVYMLTVQCNLAIAWSEGAPAPFVSTVPSPAHPTGDSGASAVSDGGRGKVCKSHIGTCPWKCQKTISVDVWIFLDGDTTDIYIYNII